MPTHKTKKRNLPRVPGKLKGKTREICEKYSAGASSLELAEEYGVHSATIRRHISGEYAPDADVPGGIRKIREDHTWLNDDHIGGIAKIIAAGGSTADVGRAYGFSGRTIRKWLQQGAVDLENGKETKCARLVVASQRALYDLRKQCLDGILNAKTKWGDADWKALSWFMSRRFPQEYGPRAYNYVEVQNGIQKLIDDVEAHMSPEAYAELIEAIGRVHNDGQMHADLEPTSKNKIIDIDSSENRHVRGQISEDIEEYDHLS